MEKSVLKIKVLTIGKPKENWLREALADYQTRLKGKIEIDWVLADKEKELIERASKEPFLIALDVKGELLTSEALSRKLFIEWGARTAFLIGGAEGIPVDLLRRATFRWSLSPLTFTHQMARLLLAEQLYRAFEIERGSKYHRG